MKTLAALLICAPLALAGARPLSPEIPAPTNISMGETGGNEAETAGAVNGANPLVPSNPTLPNGGTTSVTLIGGVIPLFDVLYSHNYGTGTCSNANFWFDGPISPVSYKTGTTTTISIMGALAKQNQQVVGTITGSGSTASITTLHSPNACIPSYVSVFSNDPTSFQWGEWLYGMFFNAATQKTYAAIYNEFYGPNGYPPNAPQGVYTAGGLAISTNLGKTFSHIAPAPNHVIARPTFLFASGVFGVGYGGITSIVLSPKDNYFYTFAHLSTVNPTSSLFCLMRTNNLDDPTSWRAWNGTSFANSFYPAGFNCTTSIPLTVSVLYLGWNKYFQKFIAVGWGYPPFTGSYCYALSDDLMHWDPAVKIMDAPAGDEVYGYPSLVDPSMMLNAGDSRAASGNLSGQTPYLAYIHNDLNLNDPYRQELRIQKLSFAGGPPPVPPPALENISARAIVGTGDKVLIVGFQIVGSGSPNPKTIIIRGIGPGLNMSGTLPTPTISLYDGTGTFIAQNQGWKNLLPTDQALLGVLAPTNVGDSAVVYGNFLPGAYTAILSGGGGTGLGLLELYDVTWQSSTTSLNSTLASFSARGYVQAGTGTMIMGFVVNGTRQAVVRGTSISTLGPAGLSPVLADPVLNFYNGSTQIASNDNWQTDPNHTQISALGLAPGNSLESALLQTMTTGAYSLLLSGKSNAPNGYALMDYYDVTP